MLSSPVLTDVSDPFQITLAGSPVHLIFQNYHRNENIKSVTVELYIWRGFQQANLPTSPTVVFKDIKKISNSDDYISIEISDKLRAFITSSNLNKNNPQWAYNTTGNSTTSGEGVFWQIVSKITNEDNTTEEDKQYITNFATLGYRYANDKSQVFTAEETIRKYANSINYDRFEFDFTTAKETAHSGAGSIIKQIKVVPDIRTGQTGVKALIAYVNRLGLWSTFTPYGKVVEVNDLKKDFYVNTFRRAETLNLQIQHTETNEEVISRRKFSVNSSLISEDNNYQIEEIMQSPKVYLTIFDGSKFEAINEGITVDSTDVTVDNTEITVDSAVVLSENVGFYNSFEQIPVRITNNSFQRKTKLNEKSSISYELTMEATANKINNIR